MLTITIQNSDKSFDIRALENQRIVDVFRALGENGLTRGISENMAVYSRRKKEYVDPELTFVQAGIYAGDWLEPEYPDPNADIQPGWAQTGQAEKSFDRPQMLFIADKDADICIAGLEAKLYLSASEVSVEGCTETDIRLNGKRIGDGTHSLREGDVLCVGIVKVVCGGQSVRIWQGEANTEILLPEIAEDKLPGPDFPYYRRSPRTVKTPDESIIKIETPKPSSYSNRRGLIQMILPSLGMLAVTVAIGIVLHRGAYMLMALGATVMTTILSVSKFVQDKKQRKEKEKRKAELYTAYLLDKRKEIFHQWTREKEAWKYNYPDIRGIAEMVHRYSSRIYERSPQDTDFLTISVGTYYGKASFSIEDKTTGLDLDTDEYLEDGRYLKETYSYLEKPKIVDLKNTHVGLIGEKHVIHEQLKIYISQLSAAHSYHELQFIIVCSEEDHDVFGWTKWLRHLTLQNFNLRALISTESARDQVLGSLYQELKDRMQRLDEGKKETLFLPHYLFIIDEPKMIADHSIMEYLGGRYGRTLGFSVIYSGEQQASLPENIETVLSLEHSKTGRLLLDEKEYVNLDIMLDDGEGVNFEEIARDLGALIHEQGITSRIPETVSFLEMYEVNTPQELQIEERWKKNNAAKSLEVPLGMRNMEDLLYLNLHEKAHGPHGLVAGTTGSGKSELIQSYILSLAVNFHPHEVGFLLIDYKGGGMAGLFRDLPHLLGTITNLDGSESMRALESIQSELRRRERIFRTMEVNHINAYTDLLRAGKAGEPIPHLFIISDEFAELKKEQPEFMKELVSTARVGRSLGVHLILATQKPAGIVDDQIWSNSRFKLCLKVQTESDSKEILHTADAANILQTGRAYLQVGNNEIYELFQSAWSGADYMPEAEENVTQDNRIYLVNELGQGMLINQDLRGAEAGVTPERTQLEAVIGHIHQIWHMENHLPVTAPWLPPLSEKIVNPHMDLSSEKERSITVAAGVVDVPQEQAQREYEIDLTKDGNIVYIASGGYGKSVFLANIALQLAAHHPVSLLNLYILDFGSNALIALSSLPHTAAYIMLDEEEKLNKFEARISEEIRVRKKKFAEVMAQNFSVYNEVAQEPLKAIAVLVDNYDALKELGYEREEFFTRLTRDGAGVGIYVVVTASRTNAIRFATLNNFKNKIAGFNFEESEVRTLTGRSKYRLPEVRGRAMVKAGDTANIMQLYTPVAFEDEVDYGKRIQEKVNEIIAAYPGEKAPQIPILPEELSFGELMRYPDPDFRWVVGLDSETVMPLGIDRQHSPFLILGESGSGKTNALRTLLNQIVGTQTVYVIDSRQKGLFFYKDKTKYITTTEELEDLANTIQQETKAREAILAERTAQGENPSPEAAGLEKWVVVIDEIDDFIELAGSSAAVIATRFERAMQYGITFLISADAGKLKGADPLSQSLKSARNGLLLSGQGYLTVFPLRYNEMPAMPDGILMKNRQCRRIRLPENARDQV
ncbi:MAG: type VII secretion protein EssC [Lachnospiraceae bacterium]|nr:type VII secretion protein EssC [Lachnospiraceae bacterium]